MIVACGLAKEARIIAGTGGDVRIVAGGGDAMRLEMALEALLAAPQSPFMSSSIERSRDAPVETRPPARLSRLRSNSARYEREGGDEAKRRAEGPLILSSGIAGALDPALRIGDIVIDGDPAIVAILSRALPAAIVGRIAGGDAILATASAKRALHATGAIAADMESHVAARVATRHGLRFAALRTISDTAGETLPPAALVGMKPDGGMALGAVLASLARNPTQLPALIRTGLHAGRAFAALGRAHHALGGFRVELADLGQLRLDMA